MNYDHTLLEMLGLNKERVDTIKRRLDPDLAVRLEAAIGSAGPVELAREIVDLAIVQEKRVRPEAPSKTDRPSHEKA